MNNRQSNCGSNKFFHHWLNLFSMLGGMFIFVIFATAPGYSQKATWRYVTTVTGGTKTYLNDEVKSLAGNDKTAWEKAVQTDSSFAIGFAEWDCDGKRRLTRQVTFYQADNSVIGTKKRGFEWTPIIPGSTADFLYRRICLPAKPLQLAQIIADRTALRSYPDAAAPLTRRAKSGEQFQIIPESGEGGWFNIVDAATQTDYWLTDSDFKIINFVSASPKPRKSSGKSRRPPRTAKRIRNE